MKNLLILIISFVACQPTYAATIYGYIKDGDTSEALIGATIKIEGLTTGTTTNNYGFYSLTLDPGIYTLICSYIGYQAKKIDISLDDNLNKNIYLEFKDTHLAEINIEAKTETDIGNNSSGYHSLDVKSLDKLPNTMGEKDIIKNIQLLPGIQATKEGTTNLSIRGGSFDQNLFLLDDAPVYNPSHALGFFSVFNSEAINNVKVYKAGYPAKYGGRLSSVIDVHMKEGSLKNYKTNLNFGLIASSLTTEGPIKKDKASFILSGRYSYAGFTANTMGSVGQYLGIYGLRNFDPNNKINFYDINAKANYIINPKNRLYISTYSGKDHFRYYSINNSGSMSWGNITATARWNHILNASTFINTTLIYSKYNYSNIINDGISDFKWTSNKSKFSLKCDIDLYKNANNHIKSGVMISGNSYFPGKIEVNNESTHAETFSIDRQNTLSGAVYLSNEQKTGNWLKLYYGLRYSVFALVGKHTKFFYDADLLVNDSTLYRPGELVQFYHGLEPRLNANFFLNQNMAIKLSYNYTQQFEYLMSNSTVGFPSDIWLPSNAYIKPQSGHQWSVGSYNQLFKNQLEFTAEVYLRKMNNIVDFRDNANLLFNKHISTQVLSGTGEAKGLELQLERKTGRFTGWISYTLSKTTKLIHGVNNNQPYPATYDRRHQLSTVLNFTINDFWSASSIFKFSSGGYITIPEGSFSYYGAAFNYYTSRNGYKLPNYHRLDLAMTYNSKKNKSRTFKTKWQFGIYNVYARNNLFALFIRQNTADLDTWQAYKMYLYSITPFISINLNF